MKLPAPLQKAYDVWMHFSHILGRIMSTILLTVLWVVVFGLYAVILKCMKLLRRDTASDTYWIDISKESSDMRHQF
jgi:hypothetical protein